MGLRLADCVLVFVIFSFPLPCRASCNITTVTLSESAPYYIIESPEFPYPYPSDSWECWVISSTSLGRPRLSLRIDEFDLQDCPDCSCDFLRVVDQADGDSWKYCGAAAFRSLVTEGSSALLEFSSDSGVNKYEGFKIRVEITSENERDPDDHDDPDDDDELEPWAIVIITVITMTFIALVAAVVFMHFKSKKTKRSTTSVSYTTGYNQQVYSHAPPPYSPEYTGGMSASAPITEPYVTKQSGQLPNY